MKDAASATHITNTVVIEVTLHATGGTRIYTRTVLNRVGNTEHAIAAIHGEIAALAGAKTIRWLT